MKLFKKLSTLCVGFLVLMTTFSFAMATEIPDLSAYPKPFVENSKYNFIPVYGDLSKGDDIAGAWDVLSGLVNSQTTTTYTENIIENIKLGDDLNNEFGTLDDRDLDFIQDGKLSFQGEDYDFREEFYTGLFNIQTSITSDNEYSSEPALQVNKGRVFRVFFEDKIDLEDCTQDQPLKIKVLGKEIKITEVDDDDKMIVQIGEEYFTNVGDSIESNGKTVTLLNVGENAVVVQSGQNTETISVGNTEYLNGLAVTVNELFYRTQLDQSSASLVIGEETTKTIRNKDDFLDEEDDFLIWELANLKDDHPLIAVKINKLVNDRSDDEIVIGNGCISIDDYLNVCLEGLKVTDYNKVTLEYDDCDIGNKAWILSSDYEESFKIGINEEISQLVFEDNGNNKIRVYYEDENGDLIYLDDINNTVKTIGQLEYQDSSFDIQIDSTNYELMIDGVNITTNTNFNTITNIISNNINLNNRDEDVLLVNGIIIEDPESNFDDNMLTIKIPANDQEAVVSIGIDETTRNNNEVITEIAPPMVKASEVSNPSADNLILFGGPVVNLLTKQFLGDIWTFKPGEAIIELKANSGKILMIVAGTEAVDTRRACRVLRDYNKYNLKGTSVKVTGTSSLFTDITVGSGTTTTTLETIGGGNST